MCKFQFFFAGLAFALLLSCSSSSTQVGLRENWIDERDMMVLIGTPMDEWIQKVGRPTLVEISGDTSIYYYNYRPTLYTAVVYAEGKTEEAKPTLANATEVWGSRKNLMQIKVVQNSVVSAMVAAGPDKKTFVRDLNGNLVIDPKSGYTPNYSEEVKVKDDFNEFIKEYSRLNVKTLPEDAVAPESAPASADTTASQAATVGATVVPTADSAASHHATPASTHAPADTSAAAHHAPAASAHHADTLSKAAPHAMPASTPAHPANVPATSAPQVPATPATPATAAHATVPAPAATPAVPAPTVPAAPAAVPHK